MNHPPLVQMEVTANIGKLRLDIRLDCHTSPVVLIGPNGAGKSSLLSLILGILRAEQGRISIGGETLLNSEMGINEPIEARRIGYLPQDYALFPHLNVRENIEFALASMRQRGSRTQRTQRAIELLEELGIAHLATRNTRSLSGGERQRVALARALSIEPRALLLDEPLAALDVRSRSEIRAFLAEYLERLALPTLLVTHDAADARCLGRQIAVIEEGKIMHIGTWQELLTCSEPSQFLAAFLREARAAIG